MGQQSTGQSPRPGENQASTNQPGTNQAGGNEPSGAGKTPQQQQGPGGEQIGQQFQQGKTPGDQPNMVPGGDRLPPQPDAKTVLGPPIHNAKEGAAEQYVIRQQLGDVMRKIGENLPQLPDNFAKSDQEMKQAGESFMQGDTKGSMPHQKEALDQLQNGMDKSMQQMADQLQTTIMSFGFLPQGAESGYGQGFDPLGRNGKPDNGKPGDDYVKIPDEKERRRVQEIIEELRNRSNDYSRPKQEREYIDRLLDQFN